MNAWLVFILWVILITINQHVTDMYFIQEYDEPHPTIEFGKFIVMFMAKYFWSGDASTSYRQICGVSLKDLVDFEQRVKHEKISLEEASKYADYVTKKSPTRVMMQAMQKNTIPQSSWNGTSIGNLAYCAIHAKDEDARDYAKLLFDVWQIAIFDRSI